MLTRCPCDRAGLPSRADGTPAAQCGLCDLREVNAEAIDALSQHPGDCPCLGCKRAFGAQAPTVRPPACACGRPEIPGHACTVCVDPVDHAFAAWLEAERRDEDLTPDQRAVLRRRKVAHVNARTTARLAAGPP